MVVTATDANGAASQCEFVVKVRSAEEMLKRLEATLASLDLPRGIEISLGVKLAQALRRFQGDVRVAGINILNAFANQVRAQRGKSIDQQDAVLQSTAKDLATRDCFPREPEA